MAVLPSVSPLRLRSACSPPLNSRSGTSRRPRSRGKTSNIKKQYHGQICAMPFPQIHLRFFKYIRPPTEMNVMIRPLQNADIAAVADIWLKANLQAHDFVPAAYWEKNFNSAKAMLPQAEVYVFENGDIQGFIGLDGEHIEGLFVAAEARAQGIGKRLLDFAKSKKNELRLNVYQRNARAIRFYQREGFEILREGTDDATGEKDYEMIWRRDGKELGDK